MKRIVCAALGLAIMAAPLQAQSHVYLFNGNLNDQNAGPSLNNDGGTVGPNGYTFGANQGLSLDNVFTTGTYSIAFNSAFDVYGSFRKMVDFKDRTSDNGFYAYGNGANFYPITTGPNVYSNFVLNFTVITRDAATDLFTAYVNGAAQFSFTDTPGYAVFSGTNNVARFFEDDFNTGQAESAPGFVNYLAIYDTALSAREVGDLSPTTTTPEPASLALLATGLVGIGTVVRRKRNHHS